ncbi:hypothetical protein CDN99_12890 [Roseateles aquatilis]|uniref:FagA protein n=1 Tax=Roseateles aquatilis TaxID=431061 RepID=A0A246JCA1_9BURK|nr:hypothetical protein [Roseateles aquatilis]OWQ90265.1 hypothetical protein CDN99_12890 [Roseateles aquatilis]
MPQSLPPYLPRAAKPAIERPGAASQAAPMSAEGGCAAADHPGVECLRWMGLKIACGLSPDDPVLLRRHQLTLEQLVEAGVLAPIPAHEQALRLLYGSAHNTLLPWHWRRACLDHLTRPLAELQRLAAIHGDAALTARLRRFQWRLSRGPLLD